MFTQLYEGVKPTLGELEKFEATPDEVELNGKNNSPTISCTISWYMYDTTVTSGGGDSKAGPTLAPGDIVEVSEGQLMHLQGKVINVEGDVVTIMPKHEDLKVHTYMLVIPVYTPYYHYQILFIHSPNFSCQILLSLYSKLSSGA